MQKLTLCFFLLSLGTHSIAKEIQSQSITISPLENTWFSNSLSYNSSQFDTWTISTQYHYAIMENINVYVATEVISASRQKNTATGLLSGIQYSINEAIVVESNLQAEKRNHELIGIVEMSSKFRVSDKIALEAKIDYNLHQNEKSEANYQVGVGYRF